MSEFSVIRAKIDQIETIARLFDGYRVSYGQPADLTGATAFLRERLERDESVIFAAMERSSCLGFTQLYPSFSSVAMRATWVLNDLFVVPEARRRGVGRTLLDAAADFGRQQGAKRLALATAADNHSAQSLYEKLGWKRDTTFLHYNYEL